ncbi:MAG: selenium metabolism-associated LysR family transcriptional regulator [Proteobacteria bacterium]|nr:selenium metabolism-associated LysR family transcriptional regulator [Pseudomonadota bacterium]
MKIDFDLRQLEIFCQVVRHRSFSEAAKAVHLAQASVSERIAGLEKMVGAPLLDRRGRRVVPTKTGEVLYARALRLLEMKQDTCQELEDFLGIRRGEILLGASTIPGEYILPSQIQLFRESYPGVSVRMKIGDTRDITAEVLEGNLELGVVGSKSRDKNLSYQELWEDELIVAVPASHRWAGKKSVPWEDLREEPLILRESGSGTLKILENHLEKLPGKSLEHLNPVAVLGSSTAVKEGIKAGLGVSIISSRAVQAEVESGLLKALKLGGLSIRRRFYLVLNRQRALSPLAKAFARFLREQVKKA